LFDAISLLLETKKFTDIGIKEVSETAGIGRATFYRNFDYIEDVLKLKLDQRFSELREMIEPTIEEGPVDLTPFFQYWVEHPKVLNVLVKAGKWEIFTVRFGQATTINLSQFSQEMGNSQLQFEYLQPTMRAMFSSILQTWVERGCKESSTQLTEMFELPFKMYLFRQQQLANTE
jgi:AcrR family transcriptional regulator